jgi:hypothetical protein
MGYRVICNPNQWTQVLVTVGPFPYRAVVNYVDFPGSSRTIKWRRSSGGPPWYLEGNLTANTPAFFWHAPTDVYVSIDVYPGAWQASVEVIPAG